MKHLGLFITGICLALTIWMCNSPGEESEGKELADRYCGSCHQVPDPDLLPRSVWEEILPTMGAKMGVYISPLAMEHGHLLRAADMAPAAPMLTAREWLSIKTWYLENSPDSLRYVSTEYAATPLEWLKPLKIDLKTGLPAASLARFGSGKTVWYGDAAKNAIHHFSLADSTQAQWMLNGAPNFILENDNGSSLVLTMGNIHPNDRMQGQVYELSDSSRVLVDSLARPVYMSRADLNGDGREDLVISGFGYLRGDLAWYESLETGEYIKHVLRPLPGAIKTVITDMNDDGHPDILALMTQGDEGFFLYEGNGLGEFSEKRLLSFPPSYGSTSFEFRDMDLDGLEDIVYTNGDNGDYSRPIMKPYQGIRIFTNNGSAGKADFRETYFFPMHGPFNAMVEDFDLDGFPDIAAISYFPDYERTAGESFLMLLNKGINGELQFDAHTVSGALSGKWLTADRADFDNDGDIDILLGNGPIMSLYVPDSLKEEWKKETVTVLLLENTVTAD